LRPRRSWLARAALSGLSASALLTASCSLLFSVSDWDAQYGSDGGADAHEEGDAASPPDAGDGGDAGDASDSGDAAPCAPGMGDCDGDPANGCETDLLTSDASCGTCGHACLPGVSCTNGRCPAAPLVPASSDGAQHIACAPGWIYWTNGASLMQVHAGGGGPSCPCVSGITMPDCVGFGAGNVVWIEAPSGSPSVRHVYTMPDHDCCAAGQPTPVLVGLAASPWTAIVTTDGTNVYWLDAGHVFQAPLTPVLDDAGAPQSLQLTPVPKGTTDGLAVSGTKAFINSLNTSDLLVAPIDVASPAPQSIADFYTGQDVHTDGTNVLWALVQSGKGLSALRIMPLATYIPRYVATGLDKPTGLALDAQFVYDTDGDDGTVSRWPIDASDAGATVLEAPMEYVDGLCADALNLYWRTGSGAIMKGDKTPP
jgi:hypothetical protein